VNKKSKFFLSEIFASNYCKIVFFLALIVSYFLIPRHLFMNHYWFLALIFMISFSLLLTCSVRNIKEKIQVAKTYQTSIWGMIFSVLGLTALQVCGLGGAFCGTSIFLGVLTTIIPGFAVSFLTEYAVELVLVSILIQIFAIWQMGCFKKVSES
jgi:hypothetical protein